MSSKKLSKSERSRLESLQNKLNQKVLEYGRQKYIIEDIRDQLEEEIEAAGEIKDEISDIQEDYDSYVQDLYQKYGDVAIDINSGDIMSPGEVWILIERLIHNIESVIWRFFETCIVTSNRNKT